jgi:sugar lactone lactonase YvrE
MILGFEVICGDLAFPESPRWHEGELFLSEKRAGRVLAIDSGGAARTVAEIEGEPGGLGWTRDDDLLVVAMARRCVVRVDGDGAQSVYADLSSVTTCKCNDMIVDDLGNAYVGDFGYDLLAGAPPAPGVLALARPDGTSTVVAADVHFPNGCAITSDGELIVAESAANRLTAFRIEDDGSLAGRRTFADLDGVTPDGICLDAEGAVWVADPLHNAVVRVADGGEQLDRRETSQGAFACELGGDDGHALFVCTYDAAASASPHPQPIGRVEMTHVEVPRA